MSLGDEWHDVFVRTVQLHDNARLLEDALRSGRAGWTVAMTGVVVATCREMGWAATAKGHPLPDISHGKRTEYMGLDVMAIPISGGRWRLPLAIFELENDKRDWRTAYPLWKLLCVRAELRVLICYRETWEQGLELVRYMQGEVVGSMSVEDRVKLEGETLVVVGSRGEAMAFPYGFFKWWRLEKNTGRFEPV